MKFVRIIETKLDSYLSKPIDWMNQKFDFLEERFKSDSPVWDPKDMESLPPAKDYALPFTGHLDTEIKEMRDAVDRFMEGSLGLFGALGVVLFWSLIAGIILNYVKI